MLYDRQSGQYNYSISIIVIGDLSIYHNMVGKIESKDNNVVFTSLFDNHDGYHENTRIFVFNSINDKALRYEYEDGADLPADYENVYCKVGYDADGRKIENEFTVTFDLSGGQTLYGAPNIALTATGKLQIGLHPDSNYQDKIMQGTITVEDIYYLKRQCVFYPYKPNYEFICYNTAPDGSGQDYYDGMTLTSNITLYAQWKAADD